MARKLSINHSPKALTSPGNDAKHQTARRRHGIISTTFETQPRTKAQFMHKLNKSLQKYSSRVLRCWKPQCPSSVAKPCGLRYNLAPEHAISIHGYFLSEIGLGETARLMFLAAEIQGLNPRAVNRHLPDKENDHSFVERLSESTDCRINLSIDGLIDLKRTAMTLCRRRFNVAYPFWELELFPEKYTKPLQQFDSIWAASGFIYENLKQCTDKTVFLLNHPVNVPDEDPACAPTSDGLKVLFYFDFDSFSARKNPKSAVDAFRRAFPTEKDVSLTIKTRGDADRGCRSWLLEQASSDSRIKIIDKTLSRAQMKTLLADHHVYMSLHRSEGFGQGCAEALAAGKFVVATDYGGTTDFITEKTGFPVAWKRVDVGEGEYVAAQGATWAEPFVEHAAERLRQIYDSPDSSRERTVAGLRHLRQHHSVSAVGAKMARILKSEGLIDVP